MADEGSNDLNLVADADANGVGDIVFKTGTTERARIKADGTGTGLFGGSLPPLGNGTIVPLNSLWPAEDAYPPRYPTAIQTIFGSGHGYAKTGSSSPGGTVVDDTSTFLMGSQSMRITTDGTTGGPTGFVSARKTGATAIDFTGKDVLIWVMFDHPERLQDFRIDVSSDTFTNWSTGQIIQPLNNATIPYFSANQWTPFVLPWGAFLVGGGAGATRNAITGFQVRVSDLGTGPVQCWINMMASTTQTASGLLTFTFDDGYIGHFTKAKPYMDKYGYRGTFAPIINLLGTGNATTGYMSLAQAQKLVAAGWDPAVHAYTDTAHNNYASQTDAQIEADVQQAKAFMRANQMGPADNFLIPQGVVGSDNWNQIWRRYFMTARLSYAQTREVYPPARRIGLRCLQCDSGVSAATVNAQIDEAVSNNEWAILKTHNIVDASAAGTDLLTATFQSIVDHVNTSGIKVRTLSEVAMTGLT